MVGPRTKILAEKITYAILPVDGGLDAVAARYGTTAHAIWMASAVLREWRAVSEEDFKKRASAGKTIVVPLPGNERLWEWEVCKPTEKTLAEVCVARNNDPVAKALRSGMPPLSAEFLWRLLMNAPFRAAALKHSQNATHLEQHPEEAPVPADATLLIPYPIRPAAGIIAAPPNPGPPPSAPGPSPAANPPPPANNVAAGGPKTVNAVVRTPTDVDPPQGSIYGLLAAPLRGTLGRSFRHRVIGYVGTGENLHAAWDVKPAPRTTWEALDRLSATDINTLVRVYDRMEAISPALWQHIAYLRFGWYTSSLGWAMVWFDRDKLANALRNTAGLCQDDALGERWHQSKWYMFDCDCWREVVPANAREGLHFCVATKAGSGDDNIHIDEVDPASSADLFGLCEYDLSASVPHLAMVGANKGVDISPFWAVDLAIAKAWKLLKEGPMAGTKRGKVLTERLKEKEEHWVSHARALACMGKKGFDAVNVILEKVTAIVDEADV